MLQGRRKARPLMRVGALALVAATLVGQLSSYLHLLAVRHVTCAEHGELVEVSSSSDGSTHGHAGACIRQGAEAESHHDHCVIASFRRERSTTGSERSGLVLPQDHERRILERSVVGLHSPIDLILLAPKNSPPV
jgi:hypothetical protein